MINFYIPEFYYFYAMNTCLLDLINKPPEYFYDNIKIAAMYGCFPNQIWNGGRYIHGEYATIHNIIETIKTLNTQYQIPIRFTYTNGLITEEHLLDIECNFITQIANTGFNEILVNSDILEGYLRNKYTGYKYISSATRCVRDIDKLNSLIESGKYHLVLGDYRDNFDFDFLGKIHQKDKVEILIDAWCDPDCKVRELHYKALNEMQLGKQPEFMPECQWQRANFDDVKQAGHIIPVEDIYGKYYDMGFRHFKLEGRNMAPIKVAESYVYYMVKPEYANRVREILLLSQYH